MKEEVLELVDELVDVFKCLDDFLIRLLRAKAYYDVHDAADEECRQQFVDRKGSAQGRDAELPDEDHGCAGEHSEERAPSVGTLPVESDEDGRSKGRAESCPCELDDSEYRAVRILCQEHRNDGDEDDRASCQQQRLLLTELPSEAILQEVLGDT